MHEALGCLANAASYNSRVDWAFTLSQSCAITSVTLEEMEALKISENELDGIASIPIETEDVDIGVVIKEKTPNFYKISVRTTDKVDAAEFCKIFGGGGHSRAAGFSSFLPVREIKEKMENP